MITALIIAIALIAIIALEIRSYNKDKSKIKKLLRLIEGKIDVAHCMVKKYEFEEELEHIAKKYYELSKDHSYINIRKNLNECRWLKDKLDNLINQKV